MWLCRKVLFMHTFGHMVVSQSRTITVIFRIQYNQIVLSIKKCFNRVRIYFENAKGGPNAETVFEKMLREELEEQIHLNEKIPKQLVQRIFNDPLDVDLSQEIEQITDMNNKNNQLARAIASSSSTSKLITKRIVEKTKSKFLNAITQKLGLLYKGLNLHFHK